MAKFLRVFLGGSGCKESTCSAGYLGLIPASGRSPGEGNGYPLQYSCLENSMDRGAWQAIIHGVAKSQTRLSDFQYTHTHTHTHIYIYTHMHTYQKRWKIIDVEYVFTECFWIRECLWSVCVYVSVCEYTCVCIYIYIFFPKKIFFLLWFIPRDWIQFPVLYNRTLSFIHSKCNSLHLLLLSHFSRVRLCVTP